MLGGYTYTQKFGTFGYLVTIYNKKHVAIYRYSAQEKQNDKSVKLVILDLIKNKIL